VRDTESDQIVAAMPLFLIQSRGPAALQFNMLDSLGGPAVADAAPPREYRAITAFALEYTAEIAARHNAGEIQITLSAMAPAFCGGNCPRVNPLIHHGYDNALAQTWVVDLQGGEDAIWKRMEGRARTAVRKAEKQGVTVREAYENDLDVYYELHCETYHRTGAEPHPRAYFEKIWAEFLPAGLARVFIAEHQGRVVSAENFGIFNYYANRIFLV